MITKITPVNFSCSECDSQADFTVERTIDDVPNSFQVACFCKHHMPEDAKRMWARELNA